MLYIWHVLYWNISLIILFMATPQKHNKETPTFNMKIKLNFRFPWPRAKVFAATNIH